MEWLNYHHLFYFWNVTQEGGLARAAKHLKLSHSTLSVQLRSLEDFLGAELFERRGRRLVLTPFGTEIAAYAADIFRAGAELVDVARGRAVGKRSPFNVGVIGSIPNSLVHAMLEPALDGSDQALVRLRQDTLPRLLEELASGRLHLVLSDTPQQEPSLRLHAHALGETEVMLYGSPALARRYGRKFPASLEDAPVLVPASGAFRRMLDRWFAERDLVVRVVGEFDDAGAMRSFGGGGLGLFPVRMALRTEVEEACGAVAVGTLDGVRERYYALSVERKIRHRGVAAIIDKARSLLLSAAPRDASAKPTGKSRRAPGPRRR